MTAHIDQLQADLASIALDVKPLAIKSREGKLSTDESNRFDELVERMFVIKAEVEKAEDREQKAAQALAIDEYLNSPKDDVKRGVNLDTATERTADADEFKTAGRRFIESAEYKAAKKTARGIMENAVEMESFERKAVIHSGVLPASAVLPDVRPGFYRGLERPLVARDVLLGLSTTSDTVTFMQESTFDNQAAFVAEATSSSTGSKPESSLTYAEDSVPVRWLAHWMQITRQNLEDAAFMEGIINERLLTGLDRVEDNAIWNGSGTAPEIQGILGTSGVQYLDNTPTTGYWALNPVADAGTANENLNRIRRAKTKVSVTGLALPTFMVMNPADLEELDTLTDANRNYLVGGPLVPARRTFWGIPVVETDNIAAGLALMGDGSMAAIVDRQQARLYTADQHADYFIKNLFVILGEKRMALPVFRPAAFVKFDLA